MTKINPRGINTVTGQATNVSPSDNYVKEGGGYIVSPIVTTTVYKSAGQSIPVNPGSAVATFDVELTDNEGFHDNVTNNTRLTIPAAFDGKFVELIGYVQLTTTNPEGFRMLINHYNSADALISSPGRWSSVTTAAEAECQVFTPPVLVSTGDYFELRVDNHSHNTKGFSSGTIGIDGTRFTIIVRDL